MKYEEIDHRRASQMSRLVFFPDGVRLDQELVEERRFRNGVVVLRYAVSG